MKNLKLFVPLGIFLVLAVFLLKGLDRDPNAMPSALLGKPVPPLFQKVLDKTVWVRAEHGGILDFHAKPGDFVRAGQILATNYNIFGREQRLVESPVDGIILGMTTMPAVNPGGPIYHIATAAWRGLARIQKKVDESKRHTFNEMQDHLATNVALAPSPAPAGSKEIPEL